MATKRNSTIDPIREHVLSGRRRAREERVDAMREGRRLRPMTIQSGKRYNRNAQKHRGLADS